MRKTPSLSRPDEFSPSYVRATKAVASIRAIESPTEEEAVQWLALWMELEERLRRDSLQLVDAPFARES
jgi:hypothetical protein